MPDIVCENCQKIVSLPKKELPDISKLQPGQKYKIPCCHCGKGYARVQEICFFCKKRALKRDPKDNVLFCTICGLTESGMRKCLRCGHVNDPNSRWCDCGKELLSEKRGNYFLRGL